MKPFAVLKNLIFNLQYILWLINTSNISYLFVIHQTNVHLMLKGDINFKTHSIYLVKLIILDRMSYILILIFFHQNNIYKYIVNIIL